MSATAFATQSFSVQTLVLSLFPHLSCHLRHSLLMTYNLMQAIAPSWVCTAEVGSSPNALVSPNNLTRIPSLNNSCSVPCIKLFVFA